VSRFSAFAEVLPFVVVLLAAAAALTVSPTIMMLGSF
jgi:hypothetical protein